MINQNLKILKLNLMKQSIKTIQEIDREKLDAKFSKKKKKLN